MFCENSELSNVVRHQPEHSHALSIWSVFHRQFLLIYIFSVTLKFFACYITVKWDEFTIRNAILYFHVLSWHFFFVVLFHYKIFAFIVFIPFVDNVSNFRNKMLTNQKLDLMARQCQSDWMYALVIALSEYNMTLISYEFLRFCRPNWRLVTTKCWPYCTTSAWYN